jgi:REP element-mobilizing transposase RayT
MSRPLRIEFEGAYYHVSCRGNERRAIFHEDDDKFQFIERLERSLTAYHVRLLCYVLMGNHYHLLVQTLRANLSQFMMHFNGGYTNAFNRRHRRSGHLFEGRYHAVVVERDSYLLEVSRYLHLNPVRTKTIAQKSATEKETLMLRNRWSTLTGYLSTKQRDPFVDYTEILDFFGGDNPAGRRRYGEFIREGITVECPNPFSQLIANLILGGEGFASLVKSYVSEEEETREQPALRAIAPAYDPGMILDLVADSLALTPERITAKGKRTPARGMAMELMMRYCSLTQPEVGRFFNNVDYSTVSVERNRFLKQLEHDENLREAFTHITDSLNR